MPEEVAAAWRRARFFGVRPDTAWPEPGTGEADRGPGPGTDAGNGAGRPPEPALLAAARPVLERLAPCLGDGRAVLLLTDERARILWPSHGAGGADLSERRVGHNSAALALGTGRSCAVHGPEHVLDAWQDVSAVSVPVLDPAGHVRGTVTVASPLWTDGRTPPEAALAEAVAALVETELAARSRPAERALLDAYLAAASGEDRAVVAFGGHSRLVSRAAARLLSPADLEHLERNAPWGRDLGYGPASGELPGAGVGTSTDAESGARLPSAPRPGGGDGVPESWDPAAGAGPGPAPVPPPPRDGAEEPPGADLTYEIRLPSGAVAAARVASVRHQGAVVGAVAELEPVPGASARGPGRATVALAGRSVPWRRAVERAAELAEVRAPLLLAGERGTGKTTLARELTCDPLVLDAAEGPLGEGVLPSGDRPVLLRHAERLAQPDVAVLNRLLDDRPDAPLLLTYTPGTPPGPCLQRLLDALSARSVTLPALRERPEDIEDLLPAVTPRPAAGHPPLTWTLDALRALERYPWHGNVTELTHVVRALALQRRTTGPVRRCELPDPVRQGPAARPLSPMEQAERATILETLRRHGGNKARTAAALGIGRATLYRKLRSYQT
nr:helix-turn-helix domain-containing protein [Streptomyces sp. ISL-12]